jgi:hypothetical protein
MISSVLLLLATVLTTADAAAGVKASGATVPASSRHASPGLVDFVIDIPSGDNIEISDVEDEEGEEVRDASGKVVYCIAPPCGLKMSATPVDAAPVPWIHRLM